MLTPWERVRRRGLQRWLPTYLWQAPQRRAARAARRGRTTHLMFLVCDHFEPRHGAQDEAQVDARLRQWSQGYAELQQWCLEAFGTRPLHSWFYPPHHGERALPHLADWVHRGLGEVELHYHHADDTEATLRAGLRDCLQRYAQWGLLLESGEAPRTRFGFVHGDWALDNSCGGRFCGVNGELSILAEHGCWGDFTMPSANECQTRKINSVYYAVDSPERSRSHDWGRDARVGEPDAAGFFLMQGPLGMRLGRPWRPRIENASLTSENWGSRERIASWIDCNVHVQGRPEWLFIKLHTHGAIERDFDALFGERARTMHRVLNTEYNDGRRYQLHYVTARQAYNIARAAEHGMSGDPREFLDFAIQAPALRHYALDVPHQLLRCTPGQLRVQVADGVGAARLRMHAGPLRAVEGRWSACAMDAAAGRVRILGTGQAGGPRLRLEPADGLCFAGVDGSLLQPDGACEVDFDPTQEVLVERDASGRLLLRRTQTAEVLRENA